MKIGYARVSTADQNLDLQSRALTEYGCTTIYQEKISGKNTDRPELKKLLKNLKKGDQVVVWKLDRLGRSLRDLVDLVALFHEQDVNFVSLHDHIDTTTATGRFTFNIFASLAEFEREIIRERTKAGLDAARARGKTGGRPKGLSPENLKVALTALDLHDTGKYAFSEIAKRLKLPIATCYRYIKHVKDAKKLIMFYSSIEIFTFPPSPFSTMSNNVFSVRLLPLFSILEMYSRFRSTRLPSSLCVRFLSSLALRNISPILKLSKSLSSSSRRSVPFCP